MLLFVVVYKSKARPEPGQCPDHERPPHPENDDIPKKPVFDHEAMAYGGFKSIVEPVRWKSTSRVALPP